LGFERANGLTTFERVSKGIGVYVHVPFCKSRCIYCDFVSYLDSNYEEYTEYILKEIDMYKEHLSRGVSTLYIGGGTPSIFPVEFLWKIVNKLSEFGTFDEFSIEVNPDSFNENLASEYKALGVNRLSMGLQSTDDVVLKKSGRLYEYESFLKKYSIARRYFDNVNVDFIVGLPGESWKTIQENVRFVSDFAPDHVSVYLLEVHEENGNSFLKKPDDHTFQRYEEFLNALKSYGYERYEISNFALNGKYCIHNLKYWFNLDYVGLGVAAGGHIGFLRYNNKESLNDYFIALSDGKLPRNYEVFNTPEREALETLFMALRTKWGIDSESIKEKTEVDVSNVLNVLKQRFDFFDGTKLSERGMDFSNLFFITMLNVWEEYFS
jgi:oxygen-independent coproporphyrinogen-3 oxidase